MRVVLLMLGFFAWQGLFASDCRTSLPQEKLIALFNKLAQKQFQLEFGSSAQFDGLSLEDVGGDLVRIQAQASYQRLRDGDTASRGIHAWVTRCSGTLLIRGNTWLADGQLQARRFQLTDLPGKGIIIGAKNAKRRFIAFVDSRCSHCHRLMGYARALAKNGTIQIEFRQVAYLEDAQSAVSDTQAWLSALVHDRPLLSDEDYLDSLGGFGEAETAATKPPGFAQALSVINQNTSTAKAVIQINQVPGLLIYDRPYAEAYRITSYWEMNRYMQPDM